MFCGMIIFSHIDQGHFVRRGGDAGVGGELAADEADIQAVAEDRSGGGADDVDFARQGDMSGPDDCGRRLGYQRQGHMAGAALAQFGMA